jgi:hypothetical protein
MALLAAPSRETSPARRLAVAAVVAEQIAVKGLERRLGMVAEPYTEGRGGRLMRAAQVLSAAGATVLGGRSRLAAGISGAALLAASACTRFGVFEAGFASARDPKYTVVPQRERLKRQEEQRQDAKEMKEES